MSGLGEVRASRRIVFHGLGALGVAAALAGCASDDVRRGGDDVESGAALATTDEVPVGGGVVLVDEKIVVTQPTEGDFKAFTAVCTHQQLMVASVQDGVIHCDNHGSEYDFATGEVTLGPGHVPARQQSRSPSTATRSSRPTAARQRPRPAASVSTPVRKVEACRRAIARSRGRSPREPGVYRFRDKNRRVIYVGKAKNLRARLSSYFQDIGNLHQRTATMVTTAASVEWTVVKTEVEALQLEYSWIKEFDPRFNVKYRDDKSYPWLAVTVGEEFPRVMVGRGAKRKGTRYFGPYGHAWAIRETVDILLRVFPMRSCTNGVFKRSQQIGRPCLLGYIDKCAAPCVGNVTADEHRAIVDDFCEFMAGRTKPFIKRIEQQMYAASDALDFEKAARLRDDLGAMQKALEKQAVVLGDGADADVIALAEDPLEVAVQVFYVRGGRIRGQRGWVADRTDDAGTSELVETFLLQLYTGEPESVPKEILVPELPPDHATFEQLFSELRGSQVRVRVPQRGDKKSLQENVARNAERRSPSTRRSARAT